MQNSEIRIHNEEAVYQFKELMKSQYSSDNGDVQTLNAKVLYYRKGENTPSFNQDDQVIISTLNNGGYKVDISSMSGNVFFNQYNTNYQSFNFFNDVLVIEGKDSFGTGKGDYKVYISL